MRTIVNTATDIQATEARYVLQTYKRLPVVFVRGEGRRIFDIDGRAYLDFLSGIGVSVLGHGHPALAGAVAEQAAALLHTSNLYFHPLQGQVAERLAALSGLQRTFFCNSGTEAMEACLKFARRYWFTQGVRNRTHYVAFEHGFSGRSMGALSVTANPHYREPFEPLIPGVTFVPPTDVAALAAAVSSSTAAIVVEPLQGEGGVRPIPPAMAEAIERACARTGALLIADEVQCGLGRTGAPFYFQTLGLTPDLVTVGKALGGGVPVGAALVGEHVAAQVVPGDHGTTYGGNLLAMRAALVVLEALMDHGLQAHVPSAAPTSRRAARLGRHPPGDCRGTRRRADARAELTRDAAPVVDGAMARGLIVNRTAERVVRCCRPTPSPATRSTRPSPPSTPCCPALPAVKDVSVEPWSSHRDCRRHHRAARLPRGRAALRHQGQRQARPRLVVSDPGLGRGPLHHEPGPGRARARVKAHLAATHGRARAVVTNSGCANACTGPQGLLDAHEMAALDGRGHRLRPGRGARGFHRRDWREPEDGGAARRHPARRGGPVGRRARRGRRRHHDHRSVSQGHGRARWRPRAGTFRVGGMAKGSGMIEPRMATMLGYLTTDAAVDPVRCAGCARRGRPPPSTPSPWTASRRPTTVCSRWPMAPPAWPSTTRIEAAAVRRLPHGGPRAGARHRARRRRCHQARCHHRHRRRHRADAWLAARALANSLLVKTAIHGADPNWGRLVAAAGRSGARFVLDRSPGRGSGRSCCSKTAGRSTSARLTPPRIFRAPTSTSMSDLGTGGAHTATVWTCDLSKEYVHINAEYRT